MIRVLLILLSLLALVFATLYFMVFRSDPNNTLQNIALTNLAGEVVMSETLFSENAVINYFSAECGNCPQTMELIESARNAKNTDYSEFDYSYIYFGDNVAAAKSVTADLGIPEDLVFLDNDAEFMKSFDGRTVPMTLFVEAGGKVVLKRTAISNANYMVVGLKKLLR